MAISAVAGVLAQVQASARTMTMEGGFTTLYRESNTDNWSFANLALIGWVPTEVADAELILAEFLLTGLPDVPSGNGGYWLLGTGQGSTSGTLTGAEWHSSLSTIPSRLTHFAYVQRVQFSEALHWQQVVLVAGQPAPSGGLLVPYRPPVSEVKGLRKASWRRWFGS